MSRSSAAALGIGVVLSLAVGSSVVAHGGEEGLQVEPSSVEAGGSVVLAATGLEPNSDRVLVLVGPDMTIEFGTVTTDAEGMFSKELTIPSHVPAGAYDLQAIGDETLTVPVTVTAVTGETVVSTAPNSPNETVIARSRSPLELGVILVLVAIAAASGAWLVWRAERFRGASTG